MVQRPHSALFPVFSGIPQLHRLAHAVFNTRGVFAGMPFAVMPDQDRLAQRDVVSQTGHGGAGALGVRLAIIPVAVKSFRPFFGPLYQAGIFITDFPA